MNRFSDTLKQLDQALNDWENLAANPDAIPPKPAPTVKSARHATNSEAIQHARELLEKLRDQIKDLED